MTAIEAELSQLYHAAGPFLEKEVADFLHHAEETVKADFLHLLTSIKKLQCAHMTRHPPPVTPKLVSPTFNSGPPTMLHHQMTPLYQAEEQDPFSPSAPPSSPDHPSSPQSLLAAPQSPSVSS